MKAFVKVITSLVVFIIVFLFLFSTRHLSLIDSQYYQPSVVSSINSDLEKVVSDFEVWQDALRQSFKSFSEEVALKRCMSQNQTDGDIALREKISAELMLSLPSMQGIRVVEKETQRIHFSTFSTDIISKSNTSVSYAKYGKNTSDIQYSLVELASSNNKPCVDVLNNSFIFVHPFYDDYNVERGKIFFYVSAKSFARKLISEKRISLTEEINLLTDDNLNFIGILLGLPYQDSSSLKEEVLKEWKMGEGELAQISNKESISSPFWLLVTYKKVPYYIGRICDKNMFIMPIYARYFLITVISLAFFLITFLLLNLKQDKFVVARRKIQTLHANVIADILKSVESLDDEKLREKIEYRRHDANEEIRKTLGKKLSQKYEAEINAMLEQSWTRIIQVIGSKTNSVENLNQKSKDDEILTLLKEVLKQGGIKISPQKTELYDKTDVKEIENLKADKNREVTERVDGLEEIGNEEQENFEGLDEIEELEEVSDDAGLQEKDDTTQVQELDEIEELEEVSDDVGLQEKDDTTQVQELDEIEELEEVSDDVGLQEKDGTIQVQELDEIEELEEVSDDVGLQEKDDTTQVQELDKIEELEEVSDDVGLQEKDDTTQVQELDEIEELEEVEEFEEVGLDDFVSAEESSPPPKPRFEEVDDYVEPDDELFNSQSEKAEDRFRHIDIGGLDFSYLDDKKDEEKPANLLEVKNTWIDSPISDGSPLQGELEVIGDAEPTEVESLEEEAIVNKDGIYTISELKKPEPSDMEFKNLVDSVINET